MKGKDYPFKVSGLSVFDVGITKAEAEGKVHNLKKFEDFNGTYASAAAEATVGAGAGAKAMENKKGVVSHLFSKTIRVEPEAGRGRREIHTREEIATGSTGSGPDPTPTAPGDQKNRSAAPGTIPRGPTLSPVFPSALQPGLPPSSVPACVNAFQP